MQILTWNLEFWRRISSDYFTSDDIKKLEEICLQFNTYRFRFYIITGN
jgi:hypothetical protein